MSFEYLRSSSFSHKLLNHFRNKHYGSEHTNRYRYLDILRIVRQEQNTLHESNNYTAGWFSGLCFESKRIKLVKISHAERIYKILNSDVAEERKILQCVVTASSVKASRGRRGENWGEDWDDDAWRQFYRRKRDEAKLYDRTENTGWCWIQKLYENQDVTLKTVAANDRSKSLTNERINSKVQSQQEYD